MRPALDALSAVEFYDPKVQKSAKELVALTVTDAIEYLNKVDNINLDTKTSVTDKLKSAKLWVMFPDDILNTTKIDGLYEELDFEGTETPIKLFMKIQLQTWKLRLKPRGNWIKVLHNLLDVFSPSYFEEANVLSKF